MAVCAWIVWIAVDTCRLEHAQSFADRVPQRTIPSRDVSRKSATGASETPRRKQVIPKSGESARRSLDSAAKRIPSNAVPAKHIWNRQQRDAGIKICSVQRQGINGSRQPVVERGPCFTVPTGDVRCCHAADCIKK